MIITLIVVFKNKLPWKISVDDGITLLELKMQIAEHYNNNRYCSFNIVNGIDIFGFEQNDKTLKELNIKRLIRIATDYNPGASIDNIKNEQDSEIGFDMNLANRYKLYVNLIYFDSNITNSENYQYFNNFKVNIVGGFYGIDDINIFISYLEKIKEKEIPFLVLCSGSGGKNIIPICKKYSFIKEVIIFCYNYSYYQYYLHEYPGYVKKIFTCIDLVYRYIRTLEEKYKNIINTDNSTKKYCFSQNDISMKRQFLQCPVISSEEYDNCYFLVHRAYAHFFGDMNDKYEKPKYIQHNHNKVLDCIKKLKGNTYGLEEQFSGLVNLDTNNKFIEKAIREYTKESNFCYLLNRVMRNFESGLIELAYYMGPLLYGLNKYVKENPKYSMLQDMTLYRYINCTELDFYLYKIHNGHIICFPSLTSTKSKDEIFNPTGYGQDSSDEMITIKLIIKYNYEYDNKSPGIIIEDKKGTDGENLSSVPDENEVILFPFTFLTIKNISGNNIYLEIVNRKKYIEYILKTNVFDRIRFTNY